MTTEKKSILLKKYFVSIKNVSIFAPLKTTVLPELRRVGRVVDCGSLENC